jgi:hypothetical protein
MRCAFIAAIALAFVGSAFAVEAGQIDTFEDGATQGWREGFSSPNQPFVVEEDGNFFLRNESSGGNGPGSRQVMFNVGQWFGDFVSAGVTEISMDVRNSGDTDLNVRLAFQSNTGSRGATNDVFLLAPGGDWMNVTFDITDLFVESGPDTPLELLSAVNQMRILSAEEPAYRGDPIVSSIDVDNILAVPAPGAAGLLVVGAFAASRRRR